MRDRLQDYCWEKKYYITCDDRGSLYRFSTFHSMHTRRDGKYDERVYFHVVSFLELCNLLLQPRIWIPHILLVGSGSFDYGSTKNSKIFNYK